VELFTNEPVDYIYLKEERREEKPTLVPQHLRRRNRCGNFFFFLSFPSSMMNQQAYSSVAAQGGPATKKFSYNCKVEVLTKFKNPLKRFEICEELEKLRFDFRHKLVAIIQLPDLKVVFHTHETEQAIELREKLALSAKIEEASRFGENETRVTICRVPPQYKDEEIVEELKIYGEVFKINALKDRYGIQIGKRHVLLKKIP